MSLPSRIQIKDDVLKGRFRSKSNLCSAVAAMLFSAAEVTRQLQAPSFTERTIREVLQPAIERQVRDISHVLGGTAQRATLHQALHLPDAIMLLGTCMHCATVVIAASTSGTAYQII